MFGICHPDVGCTCIISMFGLFSQEIFGIARGQIGLACKQHQTAGSPNNSGIVCQAMQTLCCASIQISSRWRPLEGLWKEIGNGMVATWGTCFGYTLGGLVIKGCSYSSRIQLGIEHPALLLRMATSMASLQMPRRPFMGCNGHSLGTCWATDNQVPAAAPCEQYPQKTNRDWSGRGAVLSMLWYAHSPAGALNWYKLRQACAGVFRTRFYTYTTYNIYIYAIAGTHTDIYI